MTWSLFLFLFSLPGVSVSISIFLSLFWPLWLFLYASLFWYPYLTASISLSLLLSLSFRQTLCSPFRSDRHSSSPFRSNRLSSSPFRSYRLYCSPFRSYKDSPSHFHSSAPENSISFQSDPNRNVDFEFSNQFLSGQNWSCFHSLLGYGMIRNIELFDTEIISFSFKCKIHNQFRSISRTTVPFAKIMAYKAESNDKNNAIKIFVTFLFLYLSLFICSTSSNIGLFCLSEKCLHNFMCDNRSVFDMIFNSPAQFHCVFTTKARTISMKSHAKITS